MIGTTSAKTARRRTTFKHFESANLRSQFPLKSRNFHLGELSQVGKMATPGLCTQFFSISKHYVITIHKTCISAMGHAEHHERLWTQGRMMGTDGPGAAVKTPQTKHSLMSQHMQMVALMSSMDTHVHVNLYLITHWWICLARGVAYVGHVALNSVMGCMATPGSQLKWHQYELGEWLTAGGQDTTERSKFVTFCCSTSAKFNSPQFLFTSGILRTHHNHRPRWCHTFNRTLQEASEYS